MKLGKIFICINILVLSLLMLTGCTEKWPRIIYQNTDYRFDEHPETVAELFMEVKGRYYIRRSWVI